MLISLRNLERSYPQGVGRSYVLRRVFNYFTEHSKPKKPLIEWNPFTGTPYDRN